MQQISVLVYAVTYRLNDFVSRELSTQKGHFLISSSLKSYHIIAYVVLFVDRAVIGLNYNHVFRVRSDQCKVRCNQIAKFFKILMWPLVVIQTTRFLAYQPKQCCTPVWCVYVLIFRTMLWVAHPVADCYGVVSVPQYFKNITHADSKWRSVVSSGLDNVKLLFYTPAIHLS